jgi:transcriptional regulator with XRE-family HTH domain
MSDDAATLALFGAMLRRARVEAGLTQRQVGDRIGVAQQDVSDHERGRYQPNRQQLEGLVELLELEITPEVWSVAGMKRRPKGGWAGVVCLVEGRERPVDSLGLCSLHYISQREARNRAAGRVCTVQGCGRGEYSGGLCHRCAERKRWGAPPVNEVRHRQYRLDEL